MIRNWILNASPIISMGKADILKPISPLAEEWIIPAGVIKEIEVKRPFAAYLSDLKSGSKVVQKQVYQIERNIAAWNLGQGESEVLTLALEKPKLGVVLDDLQARKCASVFNIPLIGTIGLIFLAKRNGLIELAKPLIEQLIKAGLYIDKKMLSNLFTAIGE